MNRFIYHQINLGHSKGLTRYFEFGSKSKLHLLDLCIEEYTNLSPFERYIYKQNCLMYQNKLDQSCPLYLGKEKNLNWIDLICLQHWSSTERGN